jgi:hypothetical protein
MNKKIRCPFCLERFSIEVFPQDGEHQELIYDCEICCHPLEVKIHIDPVDEKVSITVDKSTGF